jgi:hypothetical protein
MEREWTIEAWRNPDRRWSQPANMRRSADLEIANLGWSHEYAEPGYTQPTSKGILFANWNYFPQAALDLLERKGFSIEWSDEWTNCSDCNRALRTSADSFCWEPAYEETNGALLCFDCSGKTDRDKTRAKHEEIVSCPGKFEGESAFVSYFWEQSLDGLFSHIDFADESLDYCEISEDDARIFPDLKDDIGKFIVLGESEQGFVRGRIVDADQIARWEHEA